MCFQSMMPSDAPVYAAAKEITNQVDNKNTIILKKFLSVLLPLMSSRCHHQVLAALRTLHQWIECRARFTLIVVDCFICAILSYQSCCAWQGLEQAQLGSGNMGAGVFVSEITSDAGPTALHA